MAEHRDGVPINIYKDFWDEWEKLPDPVRDKFADLLEMLSRNPYDPEVQEKCTPEANDRFGYRVEQQDERYAIYWKVITKPGFSLSLKSIDSLDGMEITLIGMTRKRLR
ncbi:MAG TPA: hypothetical protein VNJ52_05705 [Patescibacteria group bacterium]|nr:hypothetical protein [Patescibacteria group bacterium]